MAVQAFFLLYQPRRGICTLPFQITTLTCLKQRMNGRLAIHHTAQYVHLLSFVKLCQVMDGDVPPFRLLVVVIFLLTYYAMNHNN